MNTSRTETKLKKDLKSNKKKGDDVSKLSPTHSEVEEPVTLKVIDGEDIQALAIKQDDLKKLLKAKPATEEKTENILVKKKNKNAYPTVEVKVAKLMPDKPLKPIDVSDNLGILFDKNGNCVPHSILGSVEEYLQETVANGKPINLPIESSELDTPKADLYLKPKKSYIETLAGDNGEKALNNWNHKMIERKLIQNNLSKSLNRSVNDLVMNQAESARANMELKNVLDRTLPLVENGKGCRLGSEFWNQPKLIGSDDNGIFTTLTESEKGNLPSIELISRPERARNSFKENQPPVINYPWDKSKYLKKRLNQLEPLINELIPYQPEFEHLEVIGRNAIENKTNSSKIKTITGEIVKNETWKNPSVFESNNQNNRDELKDDPFSSHPDVIQPPIFGPCIIFGGQTARWSGGDGENSGIVALESRLNFETKASKRVLAYFEIFNIGTTVIYYDWKKVNELNTFNIVNKEVQRFYFDNRSNVIMPGDLLKLHICFKSEKGGIFTEKWEFVTEPKLLSGASLVLTLRGVAIQEDKHKKTRALIEKKLFAKEAEIIVKNMIDLILSGVKTPERSPSPQNAYITEEEIFSEINPEFFYDHESIIELKKLYAELDPLGIWDLSINNFKSEVMNLDELDNRKQDLLFKLNANIANMSFQTYLPNSSKQYSICYNIVCQSIDEVSSELYSIRENLNLPNAYIEDYPIVDEFNNKYENWKKEFEIFKQVEAEKKNRMEREKNKEKDKDKSGKKVPEKNDKKKESELMKKNSSKTPVPGASAKQTRASREQISSRSVSQLDKIDDRTKTPNTNLVLSEEQQENRKIFIAKAQINVYQMLCKMVDNIAQVMEDLVDQNAINEKLTSSIAKYSVNTVPLNSDFIDF